MEEVSQPEKDRMKEKTKYCRRAKVIHCSASFFKTFFPLFNQLCLLFIFHGPVKLKLRMKGAKKEEPPFSVAIIIIVVIIVKEEKIDTKQ